MVFKVYLTINISLNPKSCYTNKLLEYDGSVLLSLIYNGNEPLTMVSNWFKCNNLTKYSNPPNSQECVTDKCADTVRRDGHQVSTLLLLTSRLCVEP